MSTMKKAFDRARRADRPRLTAEPMRLDTILGRLLVCTRCGDTIDVLEATLGGRTSEQHRHIEPSEYVCGDCMTVKA